MAQAGFTPISLYFSATAAAVPTAGNLVAGELAINTVDEKLYFKNSAGTVKLLASNATSAPVLSFQTSLGGLTPSTATTGVVTLAGTLNTTSGGTGLTSFTAGDVPYYASGSVLSKLAIGTAGQFLTSTGTAPQWSTLSGVAVTTFSAGTTGFTPSSATSGAVTLAGTLATTNGGTGLTSFTANGVVFASSSSVLATGSALTFDGNGAFKSAGSTDGFISSTFVNTSAGTSAVTRIQIGNNTSDGAGQIVVYGGNHSTLASVMDINNANNADLRFLTNNTERVRLTSSSLYTASGINVGIGTSSPNAKLNSQGTAGDPASSGSTQAGNMLRASNTATGAILDIGVSNTGSRYGWLQATNSSDLSINYDLVLNKNGGNVGIGTSSPSAKLQVDATNDTSFAMSNSSSVTSGNRGTLFMFNSAISTVGAIRFGAVTDNVGTEIQFYTRPAAGSLTQTMTLSSAGNLGAGTNNPVVRLQSNISTTGVPATTGTTQTNGALRLSSSATSGIIDFGLNGSSPWIQATDYTDLSQTYNLSLNPNGGNVNIGIGNLLVGTTSLRTTGYTTGVSQYAMETTGYGGAQWFVNRADDEGTYIVLGKSRGTTVNSNTVVANADTLGAIVWEGTTGSGVAAAAFVYGKVDGATINASSMPGRLSFHTTASGSIVPTEHLRIASTGAFGLSGANYGTNGQVLTSGGSAAAPTWTTVSGGGSQWVTSGSNIYYTTGSVSIGTTSVLTYGAGGSFKCLSIDAGTNTDALGFISLAGGGGGVNYNLGRINFGLSSNTTTAAAVISGFSSSAGASTGGTIVFGTSPDISAGGTVLRLKIPAAGGVQAVTTISVGDATPSSSGAGITFPATQSASSNANTLDDYEEGTWTPDLGGTTTYSGRSGNYVKIGRVVYIDFYIEVNVIGTGSTTLMTGAPFNCSNPSTASGSTTYQANLATSVVSIGANFTNGTNIRFDSRTAASVTAQQNATFGSSTALYGCMTYLTST